MLSFSDILLFIPHVKSFILQSLFDWGFRDISLSRILFILSEYKYKDFNENKDQFKNILRYSVFKMKPLYTVQHRPEVELVTVAKIIIWFYSYKILLCHPCLFFSNPWSKCWPCLLLNKPRLQSIMIYGTPS